MSDLAGLADGAVPGVYRWDESHEAHEIDDVRHAVEVAGGRLAHLDETVTSGPALHAELARELRFPDWYGRNLDALADCLRDVPAGTVLLWDDWATLAVAEPRVFEAAVGLLGERVVVLLRGPGPDLGGAEPA